MSKFETTISGTANARKGTVILSIAYAFAIFQRTAFPQLDAVLTAGFNLTSGQNADLSASFFWVYLALQIPSGFMTDALGARRTSIIGSVIAALGCVMFAYASSLELLVISRMLISVGSTIAFVAMLRYASIYFPDEAGTLTGRGIFIGNIGGIMSGIPLTILLIYFAYHAIWLWLAVCSLLLAGGAAYHAPKDKITKSFKSHIESAIPDIKSVLLSPWCYVGIALLAGFTGTYYAFCGAIATKVLGSYGIAESKNGWIMTILLGGFALGAYFWGWMSDRVVDSRRLMVIALIGSLASWIGIVSHAFTSLFMVGILFAFMGWFSGAFSLTYKIITSKYPENLGGVAVGVMNCGTPLGAAILITLSGRLNDQFVLVPTLAAVAVALASATAIWIRRNHFEDNMYDEKIAAEDMCIDDHSFEMMKRQS